MHKESGCEAVCDLSRKFLVVDEPEVDLLDVVDNDSLQAVAQEVSGLSVSILI